MALTTFVAANAATANAATFKPKYDTTVDQKYWTASFKSQMTAMCKLLGDYIGDTNEIELTIKIDANMSSGTLATGSATEGSTNTTAKYIAKKGTMTFNPAFFDDAKKEWKGSNTFLILHEIIHCLGFSSSVLAFNANIDTSNYTFKGANVKKLNGGNAFPLSGSNDSSHFSQTLDKASVMPRMAAGGGHLLSILDLAVLADIGYSIPKVTSATAAFAIDFTLDTSFAGKFKMPQYEGITSGNGATLSLDGYAGNDTLTGDATAITALFGNGGNDTLITGAVRTVMFGDNVFTAPVPENADTYKITSNAEHMILGLDSKDKIFIAKKLATTIDLEKMTVSTIGYTYPYGYVGGDFKVILPITIKTTTGTTTGSLVFVVVYPLAGYPKFANPAMKTTAEKTAVNTAWTNATTALTARLKACMSVSD